jgi:alpha-1,2-mannosyltransferase
VQVPIGPNRVLNFLLNDEFLTRSRVRLWAVGLLIAFGVSLIHLAVTAHGLNDFKGRPLGTDFAGLYTASRLAHEGLAPAAYDPVSLYRAGQAIFGAQTPFYGWQYPPFVFAAVQPLARLPYVPALAVWLVLTLAAYLFAMRALLRSGPYPLLAADRLWLLVALAFPAVFANVMHGQNGFLSAALITGGLALLEKRPVAAGVLFGLMAFKPQLAMLIPLVLAVGGRWKAFSAAAVTVAGLVALGVICYGTESWMAFFASTQFSRTTVLEQGAAGFEKIQSVFAAVRLLGGSVTAAYGVQLAVSACTAVLLVMLWRSPAGQASKGAGLCLGALVATPYCYEYDLMLLAPAIALLASEGRARGWHRGEMLVLAALWVLPIAVRLAPGTHIPFGPVLMALCFALIVWRAMQSRFAAIAA